ncbi:unnamed protein product [Mortierella alpina]
MVAVSKLLLLLMGTVIACAAAQKTSAPKPKPVPVPAPEHSAEEMSKVIDCQTQCIAFKPPFNHPPDINAAMYMKVRDQSRINYLYKNMRTHVKPCVQHLLKLKGDTSKVTEREFNDYVQCNSKTLRKINDAYDKIVRWKDEGFKTAADWTQFRKHTLRQFTSALHKCRGGCRRIHFAHKGAPKP